MSTHNKVVCAKKLRITPVSAGDIPWKFHKSHTHTHSLETELLGAIKTIAIVPQYTISRVLKKRCCITVLSQSLWLPCLAQFQGLPSKTITCGCVDELFYLFFIATGPDPTQPFSSDFLRAGSTSSLNI